VFAIFKKNTALKDEVRKAVRLQVYKLKLICFPCSLVELLQVFARQFKLTCTTFLAFYLKQ